MGQPDAPVQVRIRWRPADFSLEARGRPATALFHQRVTEEDRKRYCGTDQSIFYFRLPGPGVFG
jgi:hypothetical protein